MPSKSLEWNAPIWFASLDLIKAFDRIENSPLFDALLQQGVPRCYCTWLWKPYKGQTGSGHGSERFNIERRVKQGDVISPILFNAGLAQEHFVCSSASVGPCRCRTIRKRSWKPQWRASNAIRRTPKRPEAKRSNAIKNTNQAKRWVRQWGHERTGKTSRVISNVACWW